jgi:hypothetical protein
MPEAQTLLLVLTIAVALFFDFTNGFHDTANAIGTAIGTRALSPRLAVGLSAVLNHDAGRVGRRHGRHPPVQRSAMGRRSPHRVGLDLHDPGLGHPRGPCCARP